MKLKLSRYGNGAAMPCTRFTTCFAILAVTIITACTKETITTNEADNISTLSADAAVAKPATPPIFGGMIATEEIEGKMQVLDNLGVTHTRYSIVLESHITGDKGYEKWVNAGYKVLLNLNYGHVNNANGRKAVPFPTDMKEYRRELEVILDKYHPEVAVIENEPTTDIFHSGPIENYIFQLRVAVDVCKKRGIKVTDGGINVQYVQQVMSGQGKGTNYEETKKLIEAYKTIALDFVNVHTHSPFTDRDNPNQYAPGVLESVADYLRKETGKQVMCNEYNQRNESTALMTSAVNAFKAGGYVYMVPRSGDGKTDKTKQLNKGTVLTNIGNAFKNAIR